jgi:hypothetical protein
MLYCYPIHLGIVNKWLQTHEYCIAMHSLKFYFSISIQIVLYHGLAFTVLKNGPFPALGTSRDLTALNGSKSVSIYCLTNQCAIFNRAPELVRHFFG